MPRSKGQNLKIFYVADYLMRETDGDLDEKDRPIHGTLMYEIQDYLKNKGIEADTHAIARDIELLREVRTAKDGKKEQILDIIGGKGKPLYVRSRRIPFADLETIAECIAASKFLRQQEANELIEKLAFLCSKEQAKRLKKEYIVADRLKDTRNRILENLRPIRYAIENKKKITFYYTRRNTNDINSIVRRWKGRLYTVSPFKIVLSEGNYYLICYNEAQQDIKAYRIDRMDEVDYTDIPIVKEEIFKAMVISDYAKQTFGMFIGGKADYITIKFHNDLLDAMYERFGNRGTTKYTKVDNSHFTIKTFIVESENFYGWICGLGGKAVIVEPQETAQRFKEYLQKIETSY